MSVRLGWCCDLFDMEPVSHSLNVHIWCWKVSLLDKCSLIDRL